MRNSEDKKYIERILLIEETLSKFIVNGKSRLVKTF